MGSLRAFYGTAYLALGSLLPVLALSLADHGLAPSEYALVLAVQPATRLVAPPLWGALADRYVGGARLLRINAWIAAAAMAAYCVASSTATAVAAVLVWAVVTTSLFPLADAGTHAVLRDRGTDFGRIRVFGSLGFLVAALGIGVVGVGEGYWLPFAVASAGYAMAGGFAGGFPQDASFARPGIGAALRVHVGRRDVRLLLVGVALYYAGHGVYDAFFGPHCVAVGMSPGDVSLLWALGVAVEVPVVALTPRWLRIRTGRQLLTIAGCVALVRWGLLALATQPWQVWALQPLHGITFGLWYMAFVHENQRRAPAGLRATVQGLGSAALGLGMVGGTLIGGPLIEAFGTAAAFMLASLAALAATACYLLLGRLPEIEEGTLEG